MAEYQSALTSITPLLLTWIACPTFSRSCEILHCSIQRISGSYSTPAQTE